MDLSPSASKLSKCSRNLQKICKTKRFCVNCRNHYLKEQITGHKKNCLYKYCQCEKCILNQHVKTVSLKERKFHKLIEKQIRKAREIDDLIEKIDAEQLVGSENQPDSEETFDSELCKSSEWNGDALSDFEDFQSDFFERILDLNRADNIEIDKYDTFESPLGEDNEMIQDYEWTKYLND